MNRAKTLYRSRLLSLPKIVLTSLLLSFANPVIAVSQSSKAKQWQSVGVKLVFSGNHSFKTFWLSGGKGMFWKDNEDRINIPPAHPWNDEVANDVVVKKGQITVRGPGFLENNGSAAPEILSAGINGNWKVETARAIFLPESEVIEEQGKLEIRWVIFPRNWQLPDSKIQLYGRLYPSGSDNAEWNLVGPLRAVT